MSRIIQISLLERHTFSYQAKFVIEKDCMYVENANRAAQEMILTPDNAEPNPKNPIIADFFRNIGYADKLGSGVRNLFKYCKFYSGRDPKLMEGDIFRIIVPLDEDLAVESTTQSATEETILKLLKKESTLTQREIADRLSMNQNTVKYYIRKMQRNGMIVREGTSRKGEWIIK